MDESPEREHDDLLKSTVFSLEAEYRAYRRAADHYHTKAEQGFQVVLNLILRSRGETETVSEVVIAGEAAPRLKHTGLTTRETQVLKLIAAGNSTKQTAYILGIQFKTAAGHRSQLMKKLGIHDTASLVRYAIRVGLVEA